MFKVDIPGYGTLELEHLVLDYNGTLAVDGTLVEGVAERLVGLADHLDIHVVTADTFGKARENLEGLPCELVLLEPGGQDEAKGEFVKGLGAGSTAAIGNGCNDRLMLEGAVLGIAVVLDEGASSRTVMAADVVCRSITSALDLLTNPIRLVATLRS